MIARWTERLEVSAVRCAEVLSRHKYVVLLLFCAGYLCATFYRASRKLFWFDEVFTVYVSRLPDLTSVWRALVQGADLNPPLIYGLIHLSESLFGGGHLAARLPGTIGFGIFCLCLFRFVSVRSSALGGFVSMLFPLVTSAYYYAYEARTYGAVLGFAGVALICWQSAAMQAKRRLWWLVGLCGALACAMLTHSYAVLVSAPIVLGELVRSASRKRVDWPVWAAIIVAFVAILPSFSLLRTVQSDLPAYAIPLSKLANGYVSYVAPAAAVLSGALVLFLLAQMSMPLQVRKPVHAHTLEAYELVVLITFVGIPFLAFLVAKLAGGPFYPRYGISCVAGFACLLGIALARTRAVAIGVLLLLVAQIGVSFIEFVWSPSILEPTSSLELSTDAPQFMRRYTMMARASDKESAIVLLDHLEFAPLFYYAPESVASRLTYLVRSKTDVNGLVYIKLQKCCNATGNVSHRAEFLASHATFLAYGGPRSAPLVSEFVRAGAVVTIEEMSSDHFLLSVTFKKKKD
jgi:hypothetical protein